ncbi:MAG: hypothetical protein OIF48_02645 [Silicimonas sp.]|nr:hypothetical protein [Silicimonas sp.]
MIVNVMDLRERPYRWKNICAVVQSATKDNVAEDADQVREGLGVEIDYAERMGITVREAVQWAEGLGGMLTLYLYDAEEESGDEPEGGGEAV